MKDGDEIKIGINLEINLVAKRTDIPCIGCYFDSISGCKAIRNDKIKCWDDAGTLFIFKEIQP